MKKRIKNIVKKIFSRKKLLFIIAVVLVIGVVIWRLVLTPKTKYTETAKVERGVVKEELVLSGEISADEYAKLTFGTSGKIAWVGVKEGDKVEKGQALTKLDTTHLNASYQQALSTLRAAQATVDYVHDQVKGHDKDETYSQRDTRTTYEAAKDKAYESYIQAQDNLKNATLIAPFSGIVTYVAHPFSGSNIIYTESQIELINPETLYFDVTADQNEVVNLSVGQEVVIVLDAISDKEIKGKVSFISYAPKIGETGAAYKVRVNFSDYVTENFKQYKLGMSGDAKFALSQKDDVLWAPIKFVKSDTKGKYVRLNSTNGKTYVEVGLEGEDRVEVKSGVNEGDTLYY